MNDTLNYIINFLLGEDIPMRLIGSVGYTSDYSQFDRYRVVIIPSGFFHTPVYGSSSSLPSLPLTEIEGVPLLFGSPKTEWIGDTKVIHADIVASTYFLITRYEEMIRRYVRDEHGRFPGKESLPYRAGFIHRPIIDEYRKLLRSWLRETQVEIPDIKKQVRKIYLTHDVDAPFLYRSWKGFIRALRDKQGFRKSLRYKFGHYDNDPFYTFPYFFKQDGMLQQATGKENCESVFFFRAGGKTRQDKPHYSLKNKDLRHLLNESEMNKATIGLHSSYQAGVNPSFIKTEKKKLEEQAGNSVHLNRHHFLACREPEDMDRIEAAGFTGDFTMGYADIAGFRLGTCHPVHWINPVTRRLSSLILHPLTIMDCSLEEAKYMGLSYKEARAYCLNLAEQVSNAGGELILLWHNSEVREGSDSYLRKLYAELLKELRQA